MLEEMLCIYIFIILFSTYYLFLGGVRVAGFVHSKLLSEPGRTSMDLNHITDWFPTLVKLAGGTVADNLDGFDQWETLAYGEPSAREEILLNIAPKNQALRVGDWKIIQQCKTSFFSISFF